MKFPTRAIVTSILATIVVAGQAVAGSHSAPAPTWKGYHSTISKYPPNYPYKKVNVTKTNTITTTTIDASRKAVGSFNPISASQKVDTSKYINNGDDLAASNWASLVGPQGDSSFRNKTGSEGGVSKDVHGFFNRVEDNRRVNSDVNQTLFTGRDNLGGMQNELQIVVNLDGKLVLDGIVDSTVGNDFGNKAGDQNSFQQPSVIKDGNTTAIASDTTTSSASNTSN